MSIIKMLSYYAKDLSLLIVEDEKSIIEDLVDSLGNFFKTIDYAYNGEEALKKYKANRADIILTDITMPVMNGVIMSRKIKAINPEQAIVVVSAHSDTKYMIELIDINVDKFILKPFDINTLMYKLLKVAEQVVYQKEFKEFFKKRRQEALDHIRALEPKTTLATEAKELEEDDLSELSNDEISKENYHFSHTREDAQTMMSQIENDDLIWRTFKDDIPELLQLSEEFADSIDLMELDGFTSEIRDSIVQILRGYVLIFSTLDQMVRMTEVLENIIEFLEELEPEKFTELQQQKIKLLAYINDDITRFLQTIFVYQDSIDIYYLEDSLESSLVQLKNNIYGIEFDDDEDDLELF